MPTSYTSLLGLALPVTGELAGTWGDTVNDYLTKYLDAAVAGAQTISGSQTAVTLTTTNGSTLTQAGSSATGSAQYQIINCTGNPAGLLTITVPAQSKAYLVLNATSTSQSVKVVGAGPTTGVTMVSGEKALIAWDGSDFVKVASSVADGVTTLSFGTTGLTPSTATSGAITVAGTLATTNGGTGLTSFTANGVLYASSSSALATGSALTFDGTNLQIGSQGDLRLGDADNSNWVAFQAPATVASNVTWTLPSADGTNGQALTTNGSGTLSFSTISTAAATPTALGTVYGLMNNPSFNAAIGYQAGNSVTSGYNLALLGYQAGLNVTSGGNISAVGASALLSNTTGYSNAAIGTSALRANTTGASNTGLGDQALYSNTTASNNTATGYQALYSNTTGAQNSAYAAFALYSNTTGTLNNAFGSNALYFNTTGNYNTAVGHSALQSNTTATGNAAFGYQALYSNTTGGTNLAVGYQTMYTNTTGGANTAVGEYRTLYSNTTGNYNVAVGGQALQANTTASNNTAVGYQALYSNTTCPQNVAVGYQAGYSQTTGTGGEGNSTYIGYLAGYGVTTGYRITAIGSNAGYGGTALTTGSQCTYIGFQAQASSASVSGELVLCNATSVGKGANTGFINPNDGGVYQGNNSSSWSTTSDRRLKKNIVDNNEGLDKIAAIRVRNFEYRLPEEVDAELKPTDAIQKAGVQLGVIAQELQEVCPDCVKQESTGVLSVDSDNVFWHMINAIKQLKAELDSVKAEISTLKGN